MEYALKGSRAEGPGEMRFEGRTDAGFPIIVEASPENAPYCKTNVNY